MKIIFLHPDLGIGGAERLVVDAAVALQMKGHSVALLTSHHDEKHCFTETSDGTLKVTCVGDWLPRTVLGRCYALCAYIRMIFVALYFVWHSATFIGSDTPVSDVVVFVDQISACVPVIRLLTNYRCLFYCHFPDQLLTKRETMLKRLYRIPIDWLEETTTGLAHIILVNSKFTATVFKSTFKSLSDKDPAVLYPSIKQFDPPHEHAENGISEDLLVPTNVRHLLVSINRFERKKNVSLAIQSIALLESKLNAEQWNSTHLIVAGGYDVNLPENVHHYAELEALVSNLNLEDHVTFVRSFSAAEKRAMLSRATALLYTPSHEHFGIVPLEAMLFARPVIAVNSGGPLETVVHNETGYLVPADSGSFADAIRSLIEDPGLVDKLGKAGKQRVMDKFSFSEFARRLDEIVVGSEINNYEKKKTQ